MPAATGQALGGSGMPRPRAPRPLGRELSSGQVVDGFRLEALLHTGGMARIWQVRRVQPIEGECELVLKEPHWHDSDDPAAIVGFEVEQMILPVLHGPHVPRFVARGDPTVQPYLVIERIGGASLRPRLDQAPLPLDEVISVGARVAEALHALHRQHLVHLDVKPSNIMFRPDGQAVLVDFGLSRHDRLPDLLEEEFRLPMGTGPYMSPEQVLHIRNDPRSDLFALGVMLYHFVTGERPFGAPSNVRGLRKRLTADPVPPRALRPECPPWLQEVILRCLEVDPRERWQSGAQLALALHEPQQVVLTERARRRHAAGLWTRVRRWWSLQHAQARPDPHLGASTQVMRSPIVMAAIDIEGAQPELLELLRENVRRIVAAEPGARLACVSVMRTGRITMDERSDDSGHGRHARQLVALRHWARPLARALALEESRLTYHVLEAPDPAAAIVDFARRTHVDQIVMGARGTSALRRYLGSVSSQVVAQAECTVTVVRV